MTTPPVPGVPLHGSAGESAAIEALGRPAERRRWRPGLAISPLLLLGITLGPQGLNLLTPAELSIVDPVVPVVLATLGIRVGLATSARSIGARGVMAAAVLDSAVTLGLVSIALLLLLPLGLTPAVPVLVLPLAAGICAAPSLVLPPESPTEARPGALRIVDRGVLLPMAAGAALLAAIGAAAPSGAAWLALEASGATLAVAAGGWLIARRTASDTEQRVLITATLLLIGGIADSLALSALFSGLVAGLTWQWAGGPTRELLRRDVIRLERPLLVGLLVVAGAHAELSVDACLLGLAYAAARTAAKAAGTALIRRLPLSTPPRGLGAHLMAPGVFGVAFALNAARATDAFVAGLLPAVVVGSMICELVALVVRRDEVAA
ncbi:MAG: hypothetical protein FJW23_13290 [Acidimicrobiia bacterium]|nr:hypothetical protein [Acidimicrobiia bacterium]